MSIRVESLSHSYGPKQALTDISFKLSDGGFHALLGPNGAGKSTLFSLITRLNALQSGDIQIDGISIRKQPAAVMSRLGVVFQQSSLDLDLTVQQNLLYHASLHGISAKTARNRVQEELQRMGLAERSTEKVRSMNGGHRRRVEIARALLHKPGILLLDEPTVGLDPQTRRALNNHVRHLCADSGLTVLWATHLMEEISIDDPVLLLKHGRLLLDDCAQQMLRLTGMDNMNDAFHRLSENSAGGVVS